MGANLDETARRQHTDGFPHRRARDVEATGKLNFIERSAGSKLAADDVVGELQT